MWGNAILKIAQHKRTCGGSVGIGSPSCVPTRTLSSPFCIGALLTRLTDTVADGVGSFPALFFRALPSSAPSVPCGRGALNCGRKHEVSGERLSATSAFLALSTRGPAQRMADAEVRLLSTDDCSMGTWTRTCVCTAELGRAELGCDELGHGELGRDELECDELRRGELGRGELGCGELGRGELGCGELGRCELGHGDLVRAELGCAELGRAELGRNELERGCGDLGRDELERDELGRNELGCDELGRGELCMW